MANINYAAREINTKIVYYGPGLCGKTTNLGYLYAQLQPKIKGKLMSLATELDQTLFFDFMPVELGNIRGYKLRFHLYTVPGQVFYNASRKLVLKGVDGLVFVADSQAERIDENIESYDNLIQNLKEYKKKLENIPMVMQYNKRDLPSIMTIDELEKNLNKRRLTFYEAVAIRGVGVYETLRALATLTLKQIETSKIV